MILTHSLSPHFPSGRDDVYQLEEEDINIKHQPYVDVEIFESQMQPFRLYPLLLLSIAKS